MATLTEADARAARDMRERAAAICDKLGDAEFAHRANASNLGIATIAQRHYMACAAAIRALPLEVAPSELELVGAGGLK